jgi:hypothetical protein
MSAPITFVVNGAAVAKGRPRMTRKGFAYTPAATRKYEAHARLAAGLAMADQPPLQGPEVAESACSTGRHWKTRCAKNSSRDKCGECWT